MRVTWDPVGAIADLALLVVMTLLTGSVYLGLLGVVAAYVVANIRKARER